MARLCEVPRTDPAESGARGASCRESPGQPVNVVPEAVVSMERNRIRLPHVDEAAVSHGSKLIDVFVASDRERHGAG
jgi:hypothetical protein